MYMSSELILGVIGTITGIIGTITGLMNLALKRIQEKPILKISDTIISLKQKGEKVESQVSFNIDNIGDRATTIVRINVIFGPDVEVIEGLKNISAHSSIRIPEKSDSTINFTFPKDVKFADGSEKRYFEKEEKLEIIVIHTHNKVEKRYDVPPPSKWQALYKGGPTVFILG